MNHKKGSDKLDALFIKNDSLRKEVENEANEWDYLIGDIFGVETKDKLKKEKINVESNNTDSKVSLEKPTNNWDDLITKCSDYLREEGIEPENLTLPPTEHDLTKRDILFAFIIATIVIILPSLGEGEGKGQKRKMGKIKYKLDQLQKNADKGKIDEFKIDKFKVGKLEIDEIELGKGKFGEVLKLIFGDEKKVAEFMDFGPKGAYHRYLSGHDLLTAFPKGIKESKVIEVFQHLLRDSCGATGIPAIGSTVFLNMVAKLNNKENIDSLIKSLDGIGHKDISQYTGVRMEDIGGSLSASLLLFGYNKLNKIPKHSMRKEKMAIITHGLIIVGIMILVHIDKVKTFFPKRSHINHVSLKLLVKNMLSLNFKANALGKENKRLSKNIENRLENLKEQYLNSYNDNVIYLEEYF